MKHQDYDKREQKEKEKKGYLNVQLKPILDKIVAGCHYNHQLQIQDAGLVKAGVLLPCDVLPQPLIPNEELLGCPKEVTSKRGKH